MAKVKALVLPAEAATSSDAVNFAGFPGRWMPDEPVALETLGLDLSDARAFINEHNLPLYERNGFRVVGELQALGYGPTIWRMWREAPPRT